jgi:Protein of unknown function (DUF4230)
MSNQKSQLGTSLRGVGLILVGGGLLSVSLVGLEVWRSGDRVLTTLSRYFNAPPPAPKVEVQSVVIQQMRESSELTTAVFTMQAVVPTNQDTAIGSWVIGSTKLLYVAQGEVKAGVDLSKLSAANVKVVNDRVQILLPPPQILTSKIDVTRSKVYDYNRGFLGLGPDTAPELQTLAQQKALETIVSTACQDGVLQRANDRAKLVVTQLLTTAGHKSASVETQSPAAQACKAG